MLEIRPDLRQAYDSLCSRGEQFIEPHEAIQLEGLTFAHPVRGDTPITIDRQVLAMQGALYVGDLALQSALQEHGIETQTHSDAMRLLDEYLDPRASKLVWGFSGYATGGINAHTGKPFGYAEEAASLRALYDYLISEGKDPAVGFDGGVSEGFLALNSVVAASAKIPTIGFIPKEGLSSVGIRGGMVVAGETYEDREALVATADVLVVAGGAAGTERECIRAIHNGAAVLMLWDEKYVPTALPNTFQQHKDLREAQEDDRLVVCRSLSEIPEKVGQVLQIDVKASRPKRKSVVSEFLLRV